MASVCLAIFIGVIMRNIVVTTPIKESENSRKEADDCIKNGGGYYFRNMSKLPKNIAIGSKVFYSENGYIRGFCQICDIKPGLTKCETTGRIWPLGQNIIMDAKTWKWIEPIEQKGFQGFRYFDGDYKIVGDWLDKKPEISR